MATLAPEVLEWLADQWEAAIGSAECSGIVNDSGDRGMTSKHWSRQDNAAGSWAVTHSKDKNGPANMSAAIDMTMHNDADMFAVHKRFKALYNARATDPRAAYVDCFNGWDGSGGPGRYDLPAGTISGTDDSHKWHEHVETFYQYTGTDAESWKAARAILSVVKGETAEQWLASEEEDEMAYTVAQHQAMPWQYASGGITGNDETPAGNVSTLYVLNQAWQLGVQNAAALAEIAKRVDIDPDELAAIQQSAWEGANQGASAAVDEQAIAGAIMVALEQAGLDPQAWADAIEAGVRSIFADAGTPDEPAAASAQG